MADLFKHDPLTRPSLLDLFTPPQGYRGDSCLIVGFAADPAFLEEAMLQFTGQVAAARACNAVLQGLVFLDPRQAPEMTMPAPGLVRLVQKAQAWEGRQGLLHAKLLWLVFQNSETGDVLIRLVVSTGNWTKSGAERLIDLVWLTEFSPTPAAQAMNMRQEAADCRAAAGFLRQVAALFCVDAVKQYRDLLEGALGYLSVTDDRRLPRSRLIDSVTVPLGQQIKERFRRQRLAHNFVLAGSGFFEQSEPNAKSSPGKPRVLSFLEEMAGGGQAHRNVLVVNPNSAGAVADWYAETTAQSRRWTVHIAGTVLPRENRSLHAKFALFSKVSVRQPLRRGAVYESNVLYLGSGNLSRQGFLSAWDEGSGNIELGVLVELPDGLTSDGLSKSLPIGAEIDAAARLDRGGEDYDAHAVPPTPAVVAVQGDTEGRWHPKWADAPVEARLRLGEREYAVGPDMPFVEDASLHTVTSAAVWVDSVESGWWIGIPVIDHTGGVCRQAFSAMSFDDLLLNLSDWTTIVEEAAGDEDDDDDGAGGNARPGGVGSAEDRDRFPIARAAMLIEQIAQVHDNLALHELPVWLRRLEALLTEALDPAMVTVWRALEIDFLSYLAEPDFRPACLADPGASGQLGGNKEYIDLLNRVRARWQLVQGG